MTGIAERPRRTLRSRGLPQTLLMLGAMSVLAVAARAEDWPQFRGANCSGVATSTRPLPVTFSPNDGAAWTADVGGGIGSPSVVAGRVFTTAMVGGKESPKFAVFCFDAESGKLQWRREFESGTEPLPPIYKLNSYASATPAADAERVYVYFTRLGLAALDVKNGETVWTQKLPEPFFIFDWGPGTSPVLYGDAIFFCQDDDLSPALYAFDRRTGRQLWKDDRSDMAVSYSHPVVCETESGPELVVAGTGKLIGYDIATGKRKWASEIFCRNIKTTPVVHNGVIYVSVESLGITYQWRATADADADGKITRDEVIQSRQNKDIPIPEAFWKKFERGDVNKDGVLEGEEIDKAFLDPTNQGGLLAREVEERAKGQKDARKYTDDVVEAQKDSSIQAVRGGGKGDVTKTHVLWMRKTKAPDHVVSPLVANGRMLLVKTGGFASCYDAANGKPLYERKRIGNEGTYLASPVFGDGKIYAAAENGHLVVLEDGPELKVLAKNDMGEGLIGTPALVDGRIYVRTQTKLFCFGK